MACRGTALLLLTDSYGEAVLIEGVPDQSAEGNCVASEKGRRPNKGLLTVTQ
jgi:hypothetical protein